MPRRALRVVELGPGTPVAIYLRVSLAEQDPTLQQRGIDEFLRHRGWVVFERYVDHGESGGDDKRPALNRLMADARRLRFKAVVVWALDRWFRDVRHFFNSVHELENVLGIRFVSTTEAFDTTTEQGELVRGIFALIAEAQRKQRARQTSAGMRARQAAGVQLGRRKVLSAEQLELANQLHREGRSNRQIAQQLRVGRSTVDRLFRPGVPQKGPLPARA